jgi:hypothetical protein
MKSLLTAIVLSLSLQVCHSSTSSENSGRVRHLSRLTKDERHQLYTAALATTDAPLESEQFKQVCKAIGIFDEGGLPNENYLPFVSAHVEWTMTDETKAFKQKIKSKQAATDFITKHLPELRP